MSSMNPALQHRGFIQSPWKKLAVVFPAFLVAGLAAGKGLGLPLHLIGSPFFPAGLAHYLPGSLPGEVRYWDEIVILGGWLIYLSLTLGIMFVRRRLLVIFLYAVLFALLIVNVNGCWAMHPPPGASF